MESIDPEYAKNLQVREGGREGGKREGNREEGEKVSISDTHTL